MKSICKAGGPKPHPGAHSEQSPEEQTSPLHAPCFTWAPMQGSPGHVPLHPSMAAALPGAGLVPGGPDGSVPRHQQLRDRCSGRLWGSSEEKTGRAARQKCQVTISTTFSGFLMGLDGGFWSPGSTVLVSGLGDRGYETVAARTGTKGRSLPLFCGWHKLMSRGLFPWISPPPPTNLS